MSGVINVDDYACATLDSFKLDCRGAVVGRPSLGQTAIGVDNTR